MGKKIKFGIIGSGRMADTMAQALREFADIDVIAVSSAAPDRAKEFARRHGIKSHHGDLTQLLCNESIRAVYIANRNAEHAPASIAALSAGKAVLCEKPFAIDVEEAQSVLIAARTARQLFMEAVWTPFLPAYKRLRHLVQSGTFGQPTHVHFDFGYPTSPKIHPLLFERNGGGVLLDRSAYALSLALSILGDVKMVEAALGVNEDGVDTNASLQLTHRSGGHSQVGLSLTSLMSNSATIACEHGMVGLMAPAIGAEYICFQHAAKRSPRMDVHNLPLKQKIINNLRRHSLMRRVNAIVSRPRVEYHPFGVSPYLNQIRHFIELLRSDHPESSVNTMDSSLATLKIIESARDLMR